MSDWIKAASPKGRFLSFKNLNDSHTITINGPIEVRDQVYQGNTIRYQKGPKAGQAKKEYLIPGLDHNAESEDAAQVILPVKEGKMMAAIGRALQETGDTEPRKDGILTLTFSGYGEAYQGGQPPKDFTAEYFPPEVDSTEWGTDED